MTTHKVEMMEKVALRCEHDGQVLYMNAVGLRRKLKQSSETRRTRKESRKQKTGQSSFLQVDVSDCLWAVENTEAIVYDWNRQYRSIAYFSRFQTWHTPLPI